MITDEAGVFMPMASVVVAAMTRSPEPGWQNSSSMIRRSSTDMFNLQPLRHIWTSTRKRPNCCITATVPSGQETHALQHDRRGTNRKSASINAFSSKYDAVRAGNAQFSSLERRGYALFRGKARCNECHGDSGKSPLFTDFTADNLGVPRNSALPFYAEDQPDAAGYAVNRLGARYVDDGVGAFLAGPDNPNRKWIELAESYRGKFQASSLRNVDKRPRPDFVKAYMHNGYFKSLKEVVHFYNTRDVLPRCKSNDPGEKVTCWPAPEEPANVNKTQMGHLGLSNAEEDAVVAFLKTLTDGYEPPAP